MAEMVGFEPTHGCPSAGFRDQSLQPLGYISRYLKTIKIKVFFIIGLFNNNFGGKYAGRYFGWYPVGG